MSLFANCASTGTAWVAAMSYGRSKSVADERLNDKLDTIHQNQVKIIKHHGLDVYEG